MRNEGELKEFFYEKFRKFEGKGLTDEIVDEIVAYGYELILEENSK